jgi:hypothetical protein
MHDPSYPSKEKTASRYIKNVPYCLKTYQLMVYRAFRLDTRHWDRTMVSPIQTSAKIIFSFLTQKYSVNSCKKRCNC